MRRVLIGAAVLTLALALAGCGKGSFTRPRSSVVSRLLVVCTEADHALFKIDRHKLRPELGLLGRRIEQAAAESAKVDEATAAKVRRLPSSTDTRLVLAYLSDSRSKLQAIARAVRHHGTSFKQLPRGLIVLFVRANSGCGQAEEPRRQAPRSTHSASV